MLPASVALAVTGFGLGYFVGSGEAEETLDAVGRVVEGEGSLDDYEVAGEVTGVVLSGRRPRKAAQRRQTARKSTVGKGPKASKAEIEAMRAEIEAEGGTVVIGGNQAKKLSGQQAEGTYQASKTSGKAGEVVLKKNPTEPQVVEERIHFRQDRARDFKNPTSPEESRLWLMEDEVLAQKELLTEAVIREWPQGAQNLVGGGLA